ncbi:MAG: hypothetical protein LBG24_07070 [Treponema sp.]|nr:hypothetical protein [Treponema sp.]
MLRLFRCSGEAKERIAPDNVALTDTKALCFQDIRNEVTLNLLFDRQVDIEIKSITSSSSHAADVYQSTCISPLIPVSFAAGERFETEIRLQIGAIESWQRNCDASQGRLCPKPETRL